MRTDIPDSAAVAEEHATTRGPAEPEVRRPAREPIVEAEASAELATAVLAATRRHPGAVVAGVTAAALLGAVDPGDASVVDLRGLDPVELTRDGGGSRAGTAVRVRRDRLDPAETLEREVGGVRVPVTSPVRTGYDVGRSLPTVDAVVVLEALGRRYDVRVEDVRRTADEHPHARGLVRLRAALALVEHGARCPVESRIRIALVAAGLVPPVVGHAVGDGAGAVLGVVDLGWPEERCALICDRDRETAHRMAGGLVLDGWKVCCIERDRWHREPRAVVESVDRMLRGRRRTLGLELRDEMRVLRGLGRPPRPPKVRLYR